MSSVRSSGHSQRLPSGSLAHHQAGPQIGLWVDPQVDPRVGPQVGPRVDPRVGPQVDPQVDPRVGPRVDPRVGPRVDPQVDPLLLTPGPGPVSSKVPSPAAAAPTWVVVPRHGDASHTRRIQVGTRLGRSTPAPGVFG